MAHQYKSLTTYNEAFTLIELVMVIVILAILSAFALPRFANLQTEARLAVLEGARAAIRSASAIANAKWQVGGDNTATSVELEGETINLRIMTDNNGRAVGAYPEATLNNGILAAAQISAEDFTSFVFTGLGISIELSTVAGQFTCGFLYYFPSSSAPPNATDFSFTHGC